MVMVIRVVAFCAHGTSTVEAGAEINILDNKRNGMENYGAFTMEDGVKFTATGNNEPSTNGGGIYNGGTLTLPANAIVMNNYAKQTGVVSAMQVLQRFPAA